MAVTRKNIRVLKPWLVGQDPTRTNAKGEREWDMVCPLHEDGVRSASVNIDAGVWYCHACGFGGKVSQLLKRVSEFIPPDPSAISSNGGSRHHDAPVRISEGSVAGWHSQLLTNHDALDEFINRRGLTLETIKAYQIGYDIDMHVYTLPIRSREGEIMNVRKYNMNPGPTSPKIFNVKGMSPVELFPVSILATDPEFIIICEGEWDALRTIQEGYPAITRTAAADVWHGDWSEYFAGRRIFLINDRDDKGQIANRKLQRALGKVADVRVVDLPYELTPKHGKDLSNFWDEHDAEAFEKLLASVAPAQKEVPPEELETVTVLDSFDSRRAGKPMRLIVTIKGRKEPGYTIPREARMICTRDAGAKCSICPMNAASGDVLLNIDPDDPTVLALLDVPTRDVKKVLAENFGVPGGSCVKLHTEVEEMQAVEVLFARPSIDHSDGTQAADYKSIKITNVGRHDTMANNTVALVGALQPDPKSQRNEIQTWEVEPLETSVDHFEVTDKVIDRLKKFQSGEARPIKKLGEISREIARSVTRIYGRPEMHAFMDLVFHSALAFNFGGQHVGRGWVEGIIVGDTRTGKSEAAHRLIQHYRAGELISCESASFAGVIGGVQQLGGKDWAVTWGVVPLNDKRLVVLDEISGLTVDEISMMSEVRSSGVAKLTKIQQEATMARTRLLWLGNPRNAHMGNYTYGVDALKPLIGNTEDIARFDMAMALRMDDVESSEINKLHDEVKRHRYPSDDCHQLLMWCWTRQPDQITWAKGAEDRVYELAQELGSSYVEDPPLIQTANVRIKIARVAVALAARLFSTKDGEQLIVTRAHVEDAAAFMNHLYRMETFGYAARSEEQLDDRRTAEANTDKVLEYLRGYPALLRYLRSTGKFRRQDLEEVLSIGRDEANGIINNLLDLRMVYKELGDIKITPTLHSILRRAK